MDRTSFELLLQEHRDTIYRTARYLVRDAEDAEDVVQETFIRLWKTREDIRIENVRSWLLRVCRNLCLDALRRRKVRAQARLTADQVTERGRIGIETVEEDGRDRSLEVSDLGTGALLYHLSLSYPQARLFGIDAVPEMLAVARRRLPPNVQLREGWAELLPFEDNQFDVVVSCSTFHYIRQPLLALREIDRVLRPGGQFTVTDWCDDYLACRICDLYLRLFNRAHFKTYGERECVRLLKETGFTEVTFERYKINWLWGLMTARATKPAAKLGFIVPR